MLNDFKAFIARGNVLDLAVGVIIGGVLLFGDKVSLVQACFMAVTVVGIVGTKLFAQA